MSGPLPAVTAAWKALISVSVDCGTTLTVTFGLTALYFSTVSAIHLSAPGASDSAQYQNVSSTFSPAPAVAPGLVVDVAACPHAAASSMAARPRLNRR